MQDRLRRTGSAGWRGDYLQPPNKSILRILPAQPILHILFYFFHKKLQVTT
jgi:hypothetical protein